MNQWRDIGIAYGSAAALVGLAAGCRFLLSLIDPQILLFSSFYPAVLVAALLFGTGPGVFSVLLSTAIAWGFFMPPHPFSVARAINLFLFLASGSLIVWMGSAYRTATRKLRQEKEWRSLLVDELRHRNKNAAAVVQSIISQSLKSDPIAANAIDGRIQALFATNDLLTRSDGSRNVSLSDLVADKVKPFGDHRVTYSGPHVVIEAQQAQSLSLVLHELATNAAKYGSLSNEHGRLRILWTVTESTLHLEWVEQYGPAILGPPPSMGFGSTLIRSLTSALGGTITKDWAPKGMTAKLTLPLLPS